MSPAPKITRRAIRVSEPHNQRELVERRVVEQRDEARDVPLAMVEQIERIRVIEIRPPALRVGITRQGVEREPSRAECRKVLDRVDHVAAPFLITGVLLDVED